MQEQGPGSSPIDNDPIDARNSPIVDTHTTNSPTWHTSDSKEIACLAYSSAINMNKNLLLPLQILALGI